MLQHLPDPGIAPQKLVHLFAREWEEREEEDRLLVERLLVLVRNIVRWLP
jgi:hypothetical protein